MRREKVSTPINSVYWHAYWLQAQGRNCIHSSALCANLKKEKAERQLNSHAPEKFWSSALHIMFPLTTLPLYMTPSLSLSASASKLKVDFICPITSQLQSLSSSCHAVLCGSDNGSNYTGSMSVPHHSSKDRLWQHDAHCWLATFSTRSGESQWKGLYAVTRKSRHWE